MYLRRTAIRRKKKSGKRGKTKRGGRTFVAHVASGIFHILHFTPISRQSMTDRYQKEPSEAKMVRLKKEVDLKT